MTPGPFELTSAQVERGHNGYVLCGGWVRRATGQVPSIKVTRLPVAVHEFSLFATSAPVRFATACHDPAISLGRCGAWSRACSGLLPFLAVGCGW